MQGSCGISQYSKMNKKVTLTSCSAMREIRLRPEYKYYEELRNPRKDREIVMRFRQSPGVKRRREKAKITTKMMTVRLTSDGATNNSVA